MYVVAGTAPRNLTVESWSCLAKNPVRWFIICDPSHQSQSTRPSIAQSRLRLQGSLPLLTQLLRNHTEPTETSSCYWPRPWARLVHSDPASICLRRLCLPCPTRPSTSTTLVSPRASLHIRRPPANLIINRFVFPSTYHVPMYVSQP